MLRNALMICYTCLFFVNGISQVPEKLLLEKIYEPNEKAFTILKPRNWIAEGGIIRWDPMASGGAANAIEAKIDFSLKNDQKGTILIHWIPDIYYVDVSGSYAASMFPEGSNYNGMPVLHKMDAGTYIKQYLAPYYNQGVSGFRIVNERQLPDIEQLCYDTDWIKEMGCRYSSAVVEYEYIENAIHFRERAFTVLQDMGPYTAGMWKNRHTVRIRAPKESFELWEPLFHEIGQSVVLNPKWIEGELKGQIQRGSTMIKTMNDIARIGQEIQKGHAETNAKIHHQSYLNLTGQEDYVNPYTHEVETGTNQWDYRWVDDLGNVLYTNSESYNPNIDINLQMDGFKRSQVKKD